MATARSHRRRTFRPNSAAPPSRWLFLAETYLSFPSDWCQRRRGGAVGDAIGLRLAIDRLGPLLVLTEGVRGTWRMTPVIFPKRYTLMLPVEPYPRTTAVGPGLADRTASRWAVPTVSPRRVTSNGDCGASARTSELPAPCHCGHTGRSTGLFAARVTSPYAVGHRRPTPRPSK
jgi:hypothetical protein